MFLSGFEKKTDWYGYLLSVIDRYNVQYRLTILVLTWILNCLCLYVTVHVKTCINTGWTQMHSSNLKQKKCRCIRKRMNQVCIHLHSCLHLGAFLHVYWWMLCLSFECNSAFVSNVVVCLEEHSSVSEWMECLPQFSFRFRIFDHQTRQFEGGNNNHWCGRNTFLKNRLLWLKILKKC